MKTKTKTLKQKLTFDEALKELLTGFYVGIRPQENFDYVVLYKPTWMNKASPDFMLRWAPRCKEEENSPNIEIRTNQFLGDWYLVVADDG